MSQLRALFVSFSVLILTAASAFGQSNPYGGTYRGSNGDNHRRIHRHCSEPYGQKAFARDYPSLANANIYHLDRELREFTKYRCLSSEQIRRLAVLYPTDRDKYEYLAFSLNYVFDIENYALAGSVLANHNARDGFYRLLVQEGVPAGDYYNVYNNVVGGYACNTCPQPLQVATPQYPQFQNQNQAPLQGQNQPYQTQPYQGQISSNQPNQQGLVSSNQPYQQVQQPRNQGNTYNNLPDPRYNNPQNLPDIYDEPTGNNSLGLNSGYRGLMTYNEFQMMKERVKQNTLDNGKLDAAKTLTRANTLTANQVAEITHLLALDNNRLDYAKFAYEYTYDRQNYLMVADALSFTNNRRSLEQFINSKK
jgi:Domain of unknown function (DUF4476)